MATYKLEEESPNTFMSPIYLGNKFVYRMIQFSTESDYKFIRDIDLRNDKLIVHGTEIKEPMFQKLYDTLRLRPNAGRVYVKSNGACYIVVEGKGVFRPIDNVIFDWSRFGVVVPNSVNDLFQKQLQKNDQELESCKEEAKGKATELEDQLFCCKKESEDVKTKLQNVQEQLSSVESELQSTKLELESSNKNIRELEYERSFRMKKDEDNLSKLQEISQMMDKIVERKRQLEEELFSCKKESEAKDAKLHSLTTNELQSMKILYEFTEKCKQDTFVGECYVIKAIEIVDDVIVN